MTQIKFNTGSKNISNLVDELINGLPVMFNDGLSFSSKPLDVPVNITEKTENYEITVIAPGFEKTDFKISLEDKILTISGTRKVEDKQETEKRIRKEFSFANFKRSFTIDEKIDATAISASYVNGVLTLNLPKKKEVKEATKEIKID